MALYGIPILEEQCIGDTLPIINSALSSLDFNVTKHEAAVDSLSSEFELVAYKTDLYTLTSAPPVELKPRTSLTVKMFYGTNSGVLSAEVPFGTGFAYNFETQKIDVQTSTSYVKAWVNFDGTQSTPVIRASYNVSSVTKNATGDFTINFQTPMADVNYTAAGICSLATNGNYATANIGYVSGPNATPTTTSFRFGTGWGKVGTQGGERKDYNYTYIQILGN